MKKLTLVLVALLLALTCVFVACGKKNETPVDNDPKPVDNTPAPVETPTVEDMTPVAEQFKKDLAANYVDLYSKEVENAIDAEKSAALLKIMGASTKEEAQKIADEFIAFLKAQKTSYDVLKDLVAEIGDVALADEDLIKEAKAYAAALDAAFAGTNTAKKAVLDAFKADEATQTAVADASARLDDLKAVKKVADTKKTGLNAKIAELAEDFAKADKKFNLDDVNKYEALVDTVNGLAKTVFTINSPAPAGVELEVGSDAYNEIFDVAALATAKATLDAAINADTVLSTMKAVVEADEALKVAAENARWKKYEWIYKDTTVVVAAKATKEEEIEAAKAACKAADVDFDETKVVEAETAASAATKNYSKSALNTAIFKLALKADVEAAVKVKDNFMARTSEKQRTDYGYGATTGDLVKDAVEDILAIEKAYADSLAAAQSAFSAFEATTYVDTKLQKPDSTATYKLQANAKASDFKSKLAAEIDALKKALKTVDEDGNKLTYQEGLIGVGTLVSAGKYEVDSTHHVDLDGSTPVVTYTTWKYSYKLGNTTLGASTAVFDLLDYMTTAANVTNAKAAIEWLVKYIGEGDYADKYELKKDYGFGKDLIMVDQAVTEIAEAGVVEIDGVAVDAPKSEAIAAKVLSPYTIAKAVVAEAEKIADAKAAALEEVKAATLALLGVGDADAITAARDLYDAIIDGSYLNKKLYEGKITAAAEINLLKSDISGETVIVRADDPDTVANEKIEPKIDTLIAAAEAIRDKAATLKVPTDAAALKGKYDAIATAQGAVDDNAKLIALMDLYVAKATAIYDAKVAGNAVGKDTQKLVSDTAVATAKANKEAVEAVRNLLVNKAVFINVNGGTIDDGTYVDVVGDTKKASNALLDEFEPADADPADITKLKNALDAVVDGTGKDAKDLKAVVVAAEEAYATALEAFKGFDALKPSDVNAGSELAIFNNATTGLIKLVSDFTKNYAADYINLKVTVDLGEDTLTFDYLTEAYRERAMIKTYKVVADVAALNAKLTTGDPSWAGVARTNLDDQTFAATVVTSIKTAEENLNAFKLDDSVYNLAEALRIINEDDPAATYDLVKAYNK